MKLLFALASPFVRKVRIMAIEAGLEAEVELVDVEASPVGTDATLLAANPLGKIPAMIRNDGPALYDSRVICRYLDDRADAGLYPSTRLWEVLTLEATADGIMDAAILMVYESRMREEKIRSEVWVEAQWAKVTRSLDVLESRWASHLAGPLDAGQITLACALGYLDFRHHARNWRDGYPGLAAWYEQMAARPSMRDTSPM